LKKNILEANEKIKRIEKEAAESYDRVAQGYNLPSHETVRNFEVVTLAYLGQNLFGRVLPGQLILVLGGGRGYIAKILAKLGGTVILGDISFKMLSYTRNEISNLLRYCRLSAFKLPFTNGVFDIVTTLLCGAYLRKEVIAEVNRVLKPGGLYVVTETPKEWAMASQPQRNMPPDTTWYKDADGNTVLLPFSYVYTLGELTSLLETLGFIIEVKETLKPENHIPLGNISNVNKSVATFLGLSYQEIPLLSAVIANKPKDSSGKE
jgi:ubiquinone/menaquinone biosynthesis C-methylase UbiE